MSSMSHRITFCEANCDVEYHPSEIRLPCGFSGFLKVIEHQGMSQNLTYF